VNKSSGEHRRIKAKRSPVANLPKTPNERRDIYDHTFVKTDSSADGVCFALLGFVLSFWPKSSLSQTVLTQQQAGSVLGIEKVAAQADGTVSGEIRNNSKNTVRDVQLFVRYTFLWKNEYHPGKESPSAAFYPTISGDIAPGGSLPFKFTPTPPLPKRTDGRFQTPSVSIAGFTQVIQQAAK
jgi:hypothetical protein